MKPKLEKAPEPGLKQETHMDTFREKIHRRMLAEIDFAAITPAGLEYLTEADDAMLAQIESHETNPTQPISKLRDAYRTYLLDVDLSPAGPRRIARNAFASAVGGIITDLGVLEESGRISQSQKSNE